MASLRSAAWFSLVVLCAGCAASDPPAPVPHTLGNDQRSAMLARLGDAMRRNGDPAGALGLYRAASAADPRNAGVLQRMGSAFLAMHDAPRAEQAFRGALANDPHDHAARRGLALALLGENRPAAALPILQQLAAGSSDPGLLRAEGAAFDMTGQPRAAQAVYRHALSLDPIDADLHGNLALSLALSGDAAEALAQMQAAIASPDPDPRQNANAVLVLALTGHAAAAQMRGDSTIGAVATEALLARARQADSMPDPRQRATAVGMLAAQPQAGSTLLPQSAAAAPVAVNVPPGSVPAAAQPTGPAGNPPPSSSQTRPRPALPPATR
jgi:Tfp pilus assembly protein PilF